jgi:hypothetical protein
MTEGYKTLYWRLGSTVTLVPEVEASEGEGELLEGISLSIHSEIQACRDECQLLLNNKPVMHLHAQSISPAFISLEAIHSLDKYPLVR